MQQSQPITANLQLSGGVASVCLPSDRPESPFLPNLCFAVSPPPSCKRDVLSPSLPSSQQMLFAYVHVLNLCPRHCLLLSLCFFVLLLVLSLVAVFLGLHKIQLLWLWSKVRARLSGQGQVRVWLALGLGLIGFIGLGLRVSS